MNVCLIINKYNINFVIIDLMISNIYKWSRNQKNLKI